eukprot:NODE_405_length_9256_cov_0.230316.p4 type:complete len:198 gc:universal NODE_405_length_9256_cov_0.230316:2097-2690(+)
MDWFHCNICSVALDLGGPGMPSAGTCGHIYCSTCLPQVESKCPICKQEIQVNCLWDDKGIVKELESFFTPSNTIMSQMQMYIRALQYQMRNYSLIIENLRQKQNQMQTVVLKAKQELVDRKTLQAEVIRLRKQLHRPELNQIHESPSRDFKNVQRSEFSRKDVGVPIFIDKNDDMENSEFHSVISRTSARSKNPFFK